jgi:hypothetical protein
LGGSSIEPVFILERRLPQPDRMSTKQASSGAKMILMF